KDCDTENENATPTVVISQRSAHEQQCGEQKRVGFDYPLNINDCRIQTPLQCWQRHVDSRPVDKRHARTQDCRGEDPWTRSSWARCNCGPRTNNDFIAGLLNESCHLVSECLSHADQVLRLRESSHFPKRKMKIVILMLIAAPLAFV